MTWRLESAGSVGVARYRHRTLVAGGYIYHLGGFDAASTAQAATWKATINNDGTTTAGAADTAMPAARAAFGATVVKRSADGKEYLVVVGGQSGIDTGSTSHDTVYYATQGALGVLAWTAGPVIPAARREHSCVAIGERLFVVGGRNGAAEQTTVYTNTIDGIIAGTAWTTLAVTSDLLGFHYRGDAVTDGRVIYLIGGHAIDPAVGTFNARRGIVTEISGTVSIEWASTTSLPTILCDHAALVFDRCVYAIGGALNAVGDPATASYRAPIYGDGNLGDWQIISAFPDDLSNTGRGRSAAMLGVPAHTMWVGGGQRITISVNSYTEDTPTFWKLAERQHTGVNYCRKLHVAYDGATQYRYSDKAFNDGSFSAWTTPAAHLEILRSVSSIQRGLGTDHYPQAADVDVVLMNNDGDADWLVNQATAANVHKATCRLFAGASEAATPDFIAWHQLGEYFISSKPTRTLQDVSFGMTENIRGLLVDLNPLPTVQDWFDSGNHPFNDPLWSPSPPELSPEVSGKIIPLRFGREYVVDDAIHYAYSAYYASAHVLCASRSNVTPTVLKHWIIMGDGFMAEVPREIPERGGLPLWEEVCDGPVTKNGVDYYIHYIKVNIWAYYYVNSVRRGVPFEQAWRDEGGTTLESRNTRFIALATPLSSTAAAVDADARTSPGQVIRDIICSYSLAGSSYLDENSVARLEQTVHQGKYAAGVIADTAGVAEVLGQIFASWDMDGFADYSGRLSLTAFIQDYTNKTSEMVGLHEVYEEDLLDFSDQHPSRGQRWAAFNRIYYDGMKEPIAVTPHVSEGPYDKLDTLLGATNFVERRIEVSWRSVEDAASGPWGRRDIDTTPRPVARFRTHLGLLRIDLGAYFRLSWTRNLGGPYSSSLFKLEEMAIDLDTMTVDTTAVWVADVDTNKPWLADEKQYLSRVSSVGTATVVDADATVEFSDATVLTDFGAAAGDHLILRDATEGTNGLKRNRAVKIQSITDGNTLELDGASDLDFGAGAGVAVAAWEIRRSHLTPPATALPNYPDGTAIYGKIADVATPPVYSDATVAHKLLDG